MTKHKSHQTCFANHFNHLPESQVRFNLHWTVLNEVCVELNTSFILWLLVGNTGMLACLPS